MEREASPQKLLICFSLLLLTWLFFTFGGIASAVEIWYGNEIFNHGFLIIPAVVYFIYIKRGLWLSKEIRSSWLALPFIIGGVLLYVVGFAGDIQLFMHAAAFGLLPFLILSIIGVQAAYAILFPLVFIVFTIPVGEQLIPWLQEVTADISVYMLKLTGVPLFRSGLYIEIPQGRFLVAEACSGISFFIASIVVGSVYSYLNFVSTKKRIGFMVLSVVYPIIANAIRVYGIILTGYLTDMEHAVGADHLIYGWFFFAIVLFSLLAIGEWVRDKNAVWEVKLTAKNQVNIAVSIPLISTIIAIFVAGVVWKGWMEEAQKSKALTPASFIDVPLPFNQTEPGELTEFVPDLANPSDIAVFTSEATPTRNNIIYQAWFDGQKSELVSGLHRLYNEKSWSLSKQFRIDTATVMGMPVRLISDPLGNLRLVASWYKVNSAVFTQPTKTKLYQTANVLRGEGAAGLMVIVSVPVSSASDDAVDNASKELVSIVDLLQTNRN
ncbi:exosortase [Alteromonas sediminis]|uniref:Exosortase n=1 Tax=Alteromonas sediminis TaxID=2259342 RepID=A0A3N5YAE7_9ALTE|nr:exosortase A [Alteromonas sediminis]RPJ65735.1 exosortase [Alteromonas sediminis]